MTTIKVREDDDEFHFGPNAIIFVQTATKQIQITFDQDGGANLVQFEPFGADIASTVDHDSSSIYPYGSVQVIQ
jgi:hypothetical protein